MKRLAISVMLAGVFAVILGACGSAETPTPQIIEKEVVVERALHQKYLVLLNHPSTSSGRTDFHTYVRGEPVEP